MSERITCNEWGGPAGGPGRPGLVRLVRAGLEGTEPEGDMSPAKAEQLNRRWNWAAVAIVLIKLATDWVGIDLLSLPLTLAAGFAIGMSAKHYGWALGYMAKAAE